jgi:flagellar biosynthesis protein FlhF
MAEILVERGASRGGCVHKIVNKYGIYFNILRERTIPPSGLFKLFSREEVEVEFSLYPQLGQGLNIPSRQPQSRKQPAAATENEENDSNLVDFAERKKQIINAAGKDPNKVMRQMKEQEDRETGQQLIIDKLNKIMEKQEQINEKNAPAQDHPSLLRITQMLRQNEFSERYISGLLDRARKELPLETLDDFNAVQNHFLVWIGESIKIHSMPQKEENHFDGPAGRILTLVGPTGVGKTTTIAKLAVVYGCGIGSVDRPPLSVRVYTIDTFKIGGSDQLQKYCEVMEVVPFAVINNHLELRKEIDMYREEADLILIDTIGSSPNDPVKLGEMKALLNACGSKAETHLVLSATTKTNDIEHMLRQFEPFNYQSVLLTKMDETKNVGNIISALAEKGKSISFITNGQQIHKDIKKANVVGFLINLEGFNVDRDEMEKRFPAAQADKFSLK